MSDSDESGEGDYSPFEVMGRLTGRRTAETDDSADEIPSVSQEAAKKYRLYYKHDDADIVGHTSVVAESPAQAKQIFEARAEGESPVAVEQFSQGEIDHPLTGEEQDDD